MRGEKLKTCTKCGLELTEDKFNKDRNSKGGLRTQCKGCRSQYRQDNKAIISEYNKQYSQANKVAHSDYSKQWYQKNRVKQVERNKQWQRDNRVVCAEYQKQYRQDNKEAYDKHKKQYYQENIVARAEYAKEHQKVHPELHRIQNQKRRSLKLQLPHTLTMEQWERTKIHFNNRCAYCAEELPLTQDHFIPLSKGGGYIAGNIVPACISCNSSKHNSTFLNWYITHKSYSKDREIKILKYLNCDKQNNQQPSIL